VVELPVQRAEPTLREPRPRGPAGADAGAVVLEPTRRGLEERERPRFGLGGNQRRLLARLDGRRTLDDCVRSDPDLQPARLARDAARLVAFGLARQVRGELPPDLLVAAMNLTARIPLDRLPPLEPERTVSPMMPRVGASPHRRRPPPQAAPAKPPRKPIALLLVLIAAAVAVIGYLS
jgi:hypothetical protein